MYLIDDWFFRIRQGLGLLATVSFAVAAAPAQLVLTEFMADNETTLADEDGDYSDWIEIHNAGTGTVDLAGWALTDNPGNLSKWVFPAEVLPGGGYLVVFASSKDRRTPGEELHTSFNLSSSGEYLALVRPDGSIATAFAPTRQFEDVAFGFGNELTLETLVAGDAPARVSVPADDGLGTSWTSPGFDDSSWIAGINGVGYDTGLPDPAGATYSARIADSDPVLYWRLNEATGALADNLGNLGSSADGTYVGEPELGQPGPPDVGLDPDNTAPLFDGWDDVVRGPAGLFNGRGAFTMMGWIRPDAEPASRTALFGQNDVAEFGFMGTELQVWTPRVSMGLAYPFPWGEWHHLAVVFSGEGLALYLDGQLEASQPASVSDYGSSPDGFNAGAEVWDASLNYFYGAIDEVSVWYRALDAQEIGDLLGGGGTGIQVDFSPWIATDIQPELEGVNASWYIRIPFVVTNPMDRLTLSMRYDDGFVAWLNGLEVASANAPEIPAWDSTAPALRKDEVAVISEAFDLSHRISALVLGTNVLAIQGLNLAATNVDCLVGAELVAGTLGGGAATPRYLLTPTPGAPNGLGTEDLGPIILAVGHSPNVPTTNDDLVVTAQVVSALSPVVSVNAHYIVMFGQTIELPLVDDGTGGDAVAGDGVWSGTISAGAAGPAQMIRYFVVAADTDARVSRWPLFPDPLDSEQYLGTVVEDPSIASALPVIHTFLFTPGGADSDAGTRGSFFFNGEFYDNVLMSLHGQSSRGWPKKSYNIDFPGDHRFDPGMGLGRVKDLKFLSNYGDKSKTHNVLAYEMMAAAGSDAHFAFHARVQRNGAFFSITDVIEDADDRWLERLGRDPEGALYKIYDTLSSPSAAEKKTREWEDASDLAALIAGLNPGAPIDTRAQYAYDNIDIPQAISYFVACALASHQDHGHKNFYVYRDSDNTGEWAIMPQDVDLTWGRNWLDYAGYFTDELFQDNVLDFYNPAQQGKGDNRLYELFFEYPQFESMYLRRLRTVMDTLLQPPGTPSNQGIIEARIRQMQDLMDPPGVEYSDADRDYENWPIWGNGNDMRAESDRIIAEHLPGRRDFLFNQNPILRHQTIPASQPPAPPVEIAFLDVSPVSGIQDREYVAIRNWATYAVDVSGWELSGAVRFRFRPGTVIPAAGLLYVSPSPAAFRQRTVSPTAQESRYVTGPYEGGLNPWGETLELTTASGLLIDSHTFGGVVSAAQRDLRITEIMYNPPAEADPDLAQTFEFIELRNTGTNTLDLAGVRFTEGIQFDFTGSAVTSLAPGAYVVVVQDQAAFASRYGTGWPVAGIYTGKLANGGETLRLDDSRGEKILEFAYDDAWHQLTDGLGFSLVVVDELALWNTWDEPEQWRASGVYLGTPGAADPGPVTVAAIKVNEALTHTDLPLVDSIELHNPEATPVDIGGWFLSDDRATPRKYRIPTGTVLGAGGFVVFDEDDFGAVFGLSSTGEEVYLFSADAAGNLTGYLHGFSFGAAANGVSFGRHVTSVGKEHFVAQSANTLGAANASPRVGPVVISEVMYHPPDAGGGDNAADEYIELANLTRSAVALYDVNYATNGWRLRNAVDYDWPSGAAIAGGGRILVVGFDPGDGERLAAFRAAYNLDPSVAVYGPWSGKLDNAGETIELKRPDTPDLDEVPYILVEELAYGDAAPWPAGPDGGGPSLQRAAEGEYGNDPANWFESAPTPGAPNVPNTAPSVSLTSPPDGAILELPGNLVLAAEASDADGAIQRVEFRANGQVIHTDSTFPYSHVWTNPPAGTHQLDARAVDDLLASSVSSVRVVQVRSVLPTVSWLSPAGDMAMAVGTSVPLEVEAADPDGAIVRVEMFNAGESLGLDLTAPYQWTFTPAAPGLHDLFAVATDDSGRAATSSVVRVQAVASIITNQTLVTAGSVWRYLDTGTDPGPDWATPGYDDSGWSSGPAMLGYGVGSEATVVSFGPNSLDKYITTYFRRAFTADPTPGGDSGILRLKRDDGAIVYLNGEEIRRVNMPSGPVTYQTLANATVQGADNDTFFEYEVSLASLQGGSNLLAVEIHQVGLRSSDISFDLGLTAEVNILGPYIIRQPADLTLPEGGTGTFLAEVGGSAPMAFQWLRDGTPVSGATEASLTLTDVTPDQAGGYRLAVSNALGSALSDPAVLTVGGGADADTDGLPDEWESTHGLDPASGEGDDGADGDPDGDGASNFEEYLAGTHPQDPTSVLAVRSIDPDPNPGHLVFTYPAASNRTTILEWSPTLDGTNWSIVAQVVNPATNLYLSVTNSPPDPLGAFYRLSVPAP